MFPRGTIFLQVRFSGAATVSSTFSDDHQIPMTEGTKVLTAL